MKTEYAENLRQVNESIRDAQGLVDEAPNDEDARRSLMDAYQQKSMLFEMAMDRSLQ
jgi:DNA-binding SARP family transcriptional activator